MNFKQYIALNETHWSQVPKYLWVETPNNYIYVYKYVGHQKNDDIIRYRIDKLKDEDGWRNHTVLDPSFGLFTRRELNEMFDDSEIIELMDDSDLENEITLEEI